MAARTPRMVVVLAVLLVVATSVGSGTVVHRTQGGQETPGLPAVDNTVTRIELAANGSARWTVTIRTRLDSQTAVEEYRAFQDRFRENRSRFLGPFESRMTAVVAGAADATGRPMSAAAFTAETAVQEVPRRWGIVEYAFTWVGFAARDDGAVVMGDAFAGGFFLATDDTLVVVPPRDYTVTTVRPAPTEGGDRAIVWTGRVDFADGRPLVRAIPAEEAPAGTGGGLGGPAVSQTVLVGAGSVLLVVAGGLAVLAYRRRSSLRSVTPPGMTDEERVLDLLESHDGRLQQAAIGDAFDWSTSKTSRILSRMVERGTIEKLQIGRENLIQLPDDEE